MNQILCTPETLKKLPDAIWVPGGEAPSVYRGSPLEMVQQMAAEMHPEMTASEAVEVLQDALAKHRRIFIGLPRAVPEEIRAGMFIYALLDLGLSRPMPEA